MDSKDLDLRGMYIRLEPLHHRHRKGLAFATASSPELYRWSPVPQGLEEAERYISTALSWRSAKTAMPFAIVRLGDNEVIGSTRYWNFEQWSWPPGHERHGSILDACEIGYTWLSMSAIRTAANTEAKQLMLTHAFEAWRVLRVCFHTDVRNSRSRAAIERIGAKFEGVLRSHRMAADNTARDSARYSILATEWPVVKKRISQLFARDRV